MKLPHDSPGALDQAGGRTSSWKAAGHSGVQASCMNMSITSTGKGLLSHMQCMVWVQVQNNLFAAPQIAHHSHIA